ncbi:MAG: transcription-repair coupling factor [Clostridia bacterium]|nr:transcription-repair coupling factor [Clostridia bacterium]
MKETVKILPNFKKFNNYINNVKIGTNPIMLSGLTDVAKVHFAYSTYFYTDKPICIITYNELQAKKIIKDLQYFSEDVVYFPRREILTYDYLAESTETSYDRINCLNNIYNKKGKIIVTTIEAVSQEIIPKQTLYNDLFTLKESSLINLEEIKRKLNNLGYERCDLVENVAEYSIRGGIIDIAISSKKGVRIELWGDEIDSIRYFDIQTQRSTEKIKNVTIFPATEFVLEDTLENIAKSIVQKNKEEAKVLEDVEAIRNGEYLSKIDKYFNSFYQKRETILDYIKEDYIIFLDEIAKIKARSENIVKDNNAVIKSLIEKKREIPEATTNLRDYIRFIEEIKQIQTIYLEKQDIGFVDKQSMHAKRNGYSFSYREVNFFRSSMDLCIKEIQQAQVRKKTIIILAGNKNDEKKLRQILEEKAEINTNKIIIETGELSAGFECFDFNLLVISAKDLFNAPKKRKKSNLEFKQGETVIFSDLKTGDYIVHKTNGIGQFIGVNTIKADNVTKDYIKIKYKDDDILYIPTANLDNIRKYIGVGDRLPKVNRLGSKEWENTKQKVKSNLREVARDLIELYAKREKIKGYAFSKDSEWQKEFDGSFEYTETEDQLTAIEEIKKDMEKPKPMDRLLCGDVGYGKTEVAIRATFKACIDQKQVAYLVPTTILANQQYEAFKDRMKEYPLKIELLNRFRTKKEQENIIKKLKLGEIDVIIGTHRLLSKDVEFKNLGLLIIDEEHRFGVKDKEKIKQLKTNVDVLSMTATPIPRTLHMSIVGVRDMSCLYEPPQNRRPVQTYVLEYDKEVIKEAITKELERDGQVFYLYNKTETIARKATEISELVTEAKVGYAHGKMSGKELEDIMIDFVNKDINVLVCTTILESGIDIPNANTIIVENADRLGLAQLYQIRGRVGRSDKQAYAYITYKRDKLINELAEKRLKAIKEFTEFGSGFKIAMRDLEIRGAGSLIGELQHGHMEQVGYDTYCKLLDEVVKEMKGIEIENDVDIIIDINVSSFIPDNYIENGSQKIEVYQNIALCKNEEDIKNIEEDIKDRFGKIPTEVINLLEIAKIKNMCKKLGVTKITQKQNNIIFNFNPSNFNIDIDNLIKKYKNQIKVSPAREPYITYKLINNENILKEVEMFLFI